MKDFTQFKEKPHGFWYEDFDIGRVFKHHWGRTITESDNIYFTTILLNSNPLYFNVPYAREHGHEREVINPMLVFTTVFGLSVEDLSENGTAFLGIEDLIWYSHVYPGVTLRSESAVIARRLSNSYPGQGICTWETTGFDQTNHKVISFKRSNLIYFQNP